jgi:hypothetical protein
MDVVNSECERKDERRACPRRAVGVEVFAALSPEAALPQAHAVDVGCGGMLMAFVEPVGFLPERRMLVSMRIDDFRFNALASVVRCDRGSDFRTYVAVKFVDLFQDDYDELCQRLDSIERLTSAPS